MERCTCIGAADRDGRFDLDEGFPFECECRSPPHAPDSPYSARSGLVAVRRLAHGGEYSSGALGLHSGRHSQVADSRNETKWLVRGAANLRGSISKKSNNQTKTRAQEGRGSVNDQQ